MAAWHAHPPATLAGAAEAAAAGWGGLMSWASEGMWSVQAAILNALNLAGSHLPKALGLLVADWINNSPLAAGARGDAHAPWVFVVDSGDAAAAKQGPFEPRRAEGAAELARRVLSSALAAAATAWAAAAFACRLAWLTVLFAPVALTAPLALQWGWKRAEWMELLRATLEAAGPAWVKWGQWSATRHDLFPPDMCSALEVLHAAAPAHAFVHTESAVGRAFGVPASEVFEWLEEAPLASGSIGQVHRARLSSKGAALTGCAPGSLVAVKVRHPFVGEAIERDFRTMVWLAHTAGALVPALKGLRLEDTLKQFEAPLHEQVDLSREAQNLSRFNRNFRRASSVSFPTPLYPLVAPDVLVESFEAGRHITAYIASSGSHPYSHRLAELGSGTMLQMMLVDNLIHSDLHPGNILVRLEPPSGLLGLAYAAVSKLLDATAGGACSSTSSSGGPAAAGAAGAAAPRPCGGAAAGVPACWASGSGRDSADCVSAAGGAVRVPAVERLHARRQEEEDGLLRRPGGEGGDGQGRQGAAAADGELEDRFDLQQQQQQQQRKGRRLEVTLKGPLRDRLSALHASWLQPRIVLLDVGMATELSGDDQTNMVGLFRAFSQLKGGEAADWVLRFSGADQACKDPQEFRRAMEQTFDELRASDAQGWGSTSFDTGADALAAVLEHVRRHGVSLPGHICAVVVTTLVLEGWSNKLDPEFSVLNQVQGMFEPATRAWHERICHAVDLVMEREDAALATA